MEKPIVIKKNIKGKSITDITTKINVPNTIADLIILSKQLNLSSDALRVIGIICGNLKDLQITPRDKNQLSLFDNDWFNIESNSLLGVDLKFNFSDFLPKGNKNYSLVRKGIEDLQNFIHEIKFEIPDEKTGKIRKFKYRSAFISSYLIEENNGFKITMNSYWYRYLINLSDGFNPYIKSAFTDFTMNSLKMYAYIKTFNIISKSQFSEVKNIELFKNKGTIISTENFIKKFDLPYKYPSHIKEKFLDRVRNELNQKADLSFNYEFIENEKKIVFVVYHNTKVLEIGASLLEVEAMKIKKALTDKHKRYELDTTQLFILSEIYVKYTYSIVLKATNKKAELRGLKGSDYVDKVKEMLPNYIDYNKIDLQSIEYQDAVKLRNLLKKKK